MAEKWIERQIKRDRVVNALVEKIRQEDEKIRELGCNGGVGIRLGLAMEMIKFLADDATWRLANTYKCYLEEVLSGTKEFPSDFLEIKVVLAEVLNAIINSFRGELFVELRQLEIKEDKDRKGGVL